MCLTAIAATNQRNYASVTNRQLKQPHATFKSKDTDKKVIQNTSIID